MLGSGTNCEGIGEAEGVHAGECGSVAARGFAAVAVIGPGNGGVYIPGRGAPVELVPSGGCRNGADCAWPDFETSVRTGFGDMPLVILAALGVRRFNSIGEVCEVLNVFPSSGRGGRARAGDDWRACTTWATICSVAAEGATWRVGPDGGEDIP